MVEHEETEDTPGKLADTIMGNNLITSKLMALMHSAMQLINMKFLLNAQCTGAILESKIEM